MSVLEHAQRPRWNANLLPVDKLEDNLETLEENMDECENEEDEECYAERQFPERTSAQNSKSASRYRRRAAGSVSVRERVKLNSCDYWNENILPIDRTMHLVTDNRYDVLEEKEDSDEADFGERLPDRSADLQRYSHHQRDYLQNWAGGGVQRKQPTVLERAQNRANASPVRVNVKSTGEMQPRVVTVHLPADVAPASDSAVEDVSAIAKDLPPSSARPASSRQQSSFEERVKQGFKTSPPTAAKLQSWDRYAINMKQDPGGPRAVPASSLTSNVERRRARAALYKRSSGGERVLRSQRLKILNPKMVTDT